MNPNCVHLIKLMAGLMIGLFLFVASGVKAQTPIVIRFSHVVDADTPKGRAAAFFARRAAELTEGKVRVDVFPDAALYKDKDELEALQLGAVDMLARALSKFAPLGVRELEVFDLPFLFDDIEQLHKVTTGPVGRSLLERLEPRGINGLAIWDNGFKSFSANRPLRTASDFKGLRMRIQPSKVLESQMRTLGAIPLETAFSDIHALLQAGVADGTENPHSTLWTERIHEVQKHITLSDHGYLGYVVIVNKRFWDNLPTSIRSKLEQAMKEATEYNNRTAQEVNADALEKVKAERRNIIHTLTADERANLKRVMLKTHEEMSSRIGRNTIEAIYRETGFVPE